MKNKHELWELKQMQALPLEAKIAMTKRRLREWHDAFGGQVYVSFSGGKDSTVLLDICRQTHPDIEAVFADTGLEYPEIREHVKSIDNVTWVKPDQNFKQVIKERGYPVVSKEVARSVYYARKTGTRSGDYYMQKFDGKMMHNGKKSSFNLVKWRFLLDAPFKISESCCDIMKKRPFKKFEKLSGKKPIIGTMAGESRLRKTKWIQYGCNAFDQKRQTSKPLSFWTEQDILQYLVQYKIPYCSVYGEIVKDNDQLKTTKCDRTGCVFCMFGCHLEKSPNRFELLAKSHPDLYSYCMKPVEKGGLGLDAILTYNNIKH